MVTPGPDMITTQVLASSGARQRVLAFRMIGRSRGPGLCGWQTAGAGMVWQRGALRWHCTAQGLRVSSPRLCCHFTKNVSNGLTCSYSFRRLNQQPKTAFGDILNQFNFNFLSTAFGTGRVG